MHEEPQDSTKARHGELSERRPITDRWVDMLRKVLIVAIVSTTVWSGCALMRGLIETGSGWLFETAEGAHATHALTGGLVLLGLMVAVGLGRGLLVLHPAWRDAEGDGVARALVSYHQTYEGGGDDPAARYAQPDFLRALRNVVVTTLTIGGGGSGGLEAPGVYLGETLGAGWSRVFKRPSADELRLYQLAGVAAAIAALLEAPFTAALFGAELFYAGRIVYRKLAYCLIAGVLGYTLSNRLLGAGGLFDAPEHTRLFDWQEILLVLIVAVGFSVPAAAALGPVSRWAERLFDRLPTVLRAPTGALATGAVAVVVWLLFGLQPHHVLGIGEHTINEVISGTGPVVLQTWWILLLAVAAKMFASATTIKSGGSAGMLVPAMYMGGLVGAAGYHLLGELGLYAGPTVAVFVAAGIAAALTSIAGVPLASIALVLEVFGSQYAPVAAAACAVCFTASRRLSLYSRLSGADGDQVGRTEHA